MKTKRLLFILFTLFTTNNIVFSQKPGDAEIQKAKDNFSKGDFAGWLAESEKAAKLGHMDGYAFIALAYDPVFAATITYPETKDATKALVNYKKSADLGHVSSAYTAGEMIRLGEGTTASMEGSLVYYKRAYELGHPKAGSTIYLVMDKNFEKYKAFLAECVGKKNYNAARELSTIYILGEIAPTDITEAKKWLEIGVNNKHGGCTYVMGYLYRNGMKAAASDGKVTLNNKEADIPKAIEYFKKGAEYGSIESIRALGEMYMMGLETTQDYAASFKYYDMGCNLNDGFSCFQCSALIVNEYVKMDMSKGAEYSTKALNLGYTPGK